MKVLVLTPINPALINDMIEAITKSEYLHDSQVDLIPLPLIATMESFVREIDYLPVYFALTDSLRTDQKLNRTIFNKKKSLTVGTLHKNTKFDIIVGYRGIQEILDDGAKRYEDSYLEMIKQDPDMEEFTKSLDLNNYYTWDDIEIELPSIHHLLLFLKGVYDGKTIQ